MTKNTRLFGISWPTRAELRTLENSLTGRDFLLYLLFGFLLLTSGFALLGRLNKHFLVSVPLYGGSIEEGVIGTPRFVNPLLAVSESDKDITNLVFSGLMRMDESSKPGLDLAESYSVSEDGLVYTFIIKQGATFHDGKPVTADDVIYTIEKVSDPTIKSPKRANWEGVTVEKIDERTITFTLRKAYTQFLDATTIGILPKHLWNDVSNQEFPLSELNEKAVGAGPYKVSSIKQDDNGIPRSYELKSFNDYINGEAYIEKIYFRFYDNENSLIKALKTGHVDNINSISPENAASLEADGYQITRISIPRVFGLFFNQNKSPVLANKTVVSAMDLAIDKQSLVNTILYGYGTPLNGPRPKDIEPITNKEESIEEAKAMLDKAGYIVTDDGTREKISSDKKTTERLAFSISTADISELKDAAFQIRDDLSLIGISVDVRIYDIGTLNQTIIKDRDYESLLFGELITSDPDLFAFWHSSQRLSPGLNVSMYTNTNVDSQLESLQTQNDAQKISELSAKITSTIQSDRPAIFLYTPSFIYVRDDEAIEGKSKTILRSSSNRFDLVGSWYINTDRVWRIFTR